MDSYLFNIPEPPKTNWLVSWHQDITINVKEKADIPNFKNWRTNQERTIVQPSLDILQSICTIRIHLDDCTSKNGALKVINGSHKNGVINIKEWIQNKKGKEEICEVIKGGILLMSPLLLHSSSRSENKKNRRVLHIEFCNKELPSNLQWKESLPLN